MAARARLLIVGLLPLLPATAGASTCASAPCAPIVEPRAILTDFGGVDRANGLAVEPDGSIVAVGESTDAGTTRFAVARYLADGGLDPSFAGDGTVLTSFGRSSNGANAVGALPGGRTLVVGYAGVQGEGFDFALARYRIDGALDPTFGSGGRVVTDFPDTNGVDVAKSVAIQGDGKIVVSGYSGTYGEDYDFIVARFRRGGALDRSFGEDGHVLTNFGGDDASQAVAIQPDGRIVAMGKSEHGGDFDFAAARYLPDGKLDPSLGRGGRVRTDLGDASFDYGLAGGVDAQGRIVIAGKSDAAGSLDFALARYLPDGRRDRSFGDRGTVLTDLGDGSSDSANAIALWGDGRILAAGDSDASGGADITLVSYLPDGTPDPSFGVRGTVLIDVGDGSRDAANAVVLVGGLVVAGGASDAAGGVDVALAVTSAVGPVV
jgi:uncharacterized delta-60 repeat protein